MSINFLAPKFLVLYVFLSSTLYMHFRGRARLPLLRQIGNHSTLMAPYNVLLYAFSAVPTRPFLDLKDFPELATLRDNWQTIRDEAVVLMGGGGLKAASDHVDIGFNSFFQRGWRRFYLKWYDAPRHRRSRCARRRWRCCRACRRSTRRCSPCCRRGRA